ncbi:MAG TPA: AMP-binding protein [Tepidisphaeraceae bacterium]|jgi:long-chain acyl-CoA synthetase|nr:AMP-binding protein [Tepidisphaeraceae bacterium]
MLFEPLFAHAQQHPQDIAIIDDRGQYTWQQLAMMSAGLGMYLSFQTDQPRVGLLLPTSAAFVASFYGTLLAGKTVVPINFLLGEKEIAHIVKDSGIDVVLTVGPLAPKVQGMPLKVIDLLTLPQSPPFPITPSFPSPAADDIAVLMYTSGTAGLPKGVLLSFGNLQSDVDAAIKHAQLSGTHSFLGILPLFHSTGMLATLIAPIQLGSRIVYQGTGFRPNHVVKAIRDHQISIVAAVPSMYGAMIRLKDYGPDDMKSLYAAISGGEPLPAVIRDGFEKKFNTPIYEGYGLTETIGPIAFNVPGRREAGSVGQLLPGAELRIADENGQALPQGQSGEVWLKGPMIMKGYHNLPNETAEVLTPEGYFKSGDLGMIDAKGYLHITGRKKDQINVSGEKASPREIEDVLNQHPAVAESAVVGKKDASRGEVVAAFVILRENQTVTADALREFCREHGLIQWKIPRDIQFVADLPRSPTGKVLKRTLVEQLNK